LHQWRFSNDEIYRIEYGDLLEELGLSIQVMLDKRLMVIPTDEGITGVIYK